MSQNCPIRFAVTSSQTVSSDDDPRGTCTQASCYPPSVPFLATGTVVVPLSSLSFAGFPGNPNVVDPSSVVGIQWQMDAPGDGCNASYRIDDIALVNASGHGQAAAAAAPSGAGGWAADSDRRGRGGRPGAATAAVTCAPTAPSSPLVTDFNSSGDRNPILFRSPSGIAGRTFFYGPPGVPATSPIIRPGPNGSPALLFATRAAPPPGTGWYGFGLTFDNCVDARAFDRRSLHARATRWRRLARWRSRSRRGRTCRSPTIRAARWPAAGACPPTFLAVPQAGTVTAAIPPMGGAFEPGALIGVQWRVPASCSATFTVDDIVFAGP